MKRNKLDIVAEVEAALKDKPMSEVDFSIKMQKLVLFLYKESTVFWSFFPIFMGSFIFFLIKNGPTNDTMVLGLIEAVLYLGFYHGLIKRIKPFKDLQVEYQDIKNKLDALVDYRNTRLI